MTFLALALAQVALAQSPAPATAANPLYQEVLEKGLVVDGVTVKLSPPILREELTEAERRSALKGVVEGSTDEFLRDYANAPFKLKARDVPYPGGVVRVVDLWFAIHANLDEIDIDQIAGKEDPARQGEPTRGEVGNMSFSGRTLTDTELKAHGKSAEKGLDRYLFSQGVLLERIKVQTVNHVVASKGGGALVVASKTDPSFDGDEVLGNRWAAVPESGETRKDAATPRPYVGSVGYTRIVQFSEKPSILLIESHVAFAEPKGWFNGSAILRSKFGLIAQDQIRSLRREVARRKKEVKTSPAPAAAKSKP